jgi:hypothetical protein
MSQDVVSLNCSAPVLALITVPGYQYPSLRLATAGRIWCFEGIFNFIFLQPYLYQGLVGYVSGIGGHFDAIEQVLGQTQRDSFS